MDADVLVVGAGVMGSATAWDLARAGRRTLVVEQFAPGHDRGSSHGDSRVIRRVYEDPTYARLMPAAYAAWDAVERAAGGGLVTRTGGLDLGVPGLAGFERTLATTRAVGTPFELVRADEIAGRFPMLRVPPGTLGIYQPEAGVLAADRCLATLQALAWQAGAELMAGARVEAIEAGTAGVTVVTPDRRLRAARVVLTPGAWAGGLLAATGLSLPFVVTREQVVYLRAGAGQDLAGLPVVIDHATWIYGLPVPGRGLVKLGAHHSGPLVDPDGDDRPVDAAALAPVARFAAELLPGLDPSPASAHACLYTTTPDEGFVLDRHPADDRIVVGAGFSGHGFKFAPLVGQALAALATDGEPPMDLGPYRIERFGGAFAANV